MQNPFEELIGKDSLPEEEELDLELVEDSQLECEVCREIVTTGYYYPTKNLLDFECSKKHMNTVKIRL